MATLQIEELLSEEDVTAIKQARLDVFGVQFALADPQTLLVLNRNGIELDRQAVVADWTSRLTTGRRLGPVQGRAMREVDADVVFHRPDPFDVAKGDRFAIQGATGIVTRVYANKGMVIAEATLDVGPV